MERQLSIFLVTLEVGIYPHKNILLYFLMNSNDKNNIYYGIILYLIIHIKYIHVMILFLLLL